MPVILNEIDRSNSLGFGGHFEWDFAVIFGGIKHRANIMKKLDIHTTAALIKYAVTEGVIDPEVW